MPDGKVTQTPAANSEGTFPQYRMNRRAELVFSELMTELGQEGRIFFVSNSARQTALAVGGTSFSDTAPAFVVDVPSGTTMIPLEVVLNQGGTVAGGSITTIITLDNIARYSSGGTALTVRSARMNSRPSTAAVAYANPTLAAVGQEMTLHAHLMAADVTPTVEVPFTGLFTWRASYPMFMVGPASLVIYSFAATTQPSYFFRIAWAELDSTTVV